MKRITYLCLSGIILVALATLCAAQNQGDSLAAYARAKKEAKQGDTAPKKVYDNDNLPQNEHISVVGQEKAPEPANADANAADAAQPAPDQPKDAQAASDQAGKAKLETTPGQSAEDRQKVYDDWQKKLADQKQQVDLAQRELDVLQREYKMRSAVEYADVGNRLRNSAQWDKQDKDYKEQIAAKQKVVEAAKQKLTDLQEQARRAGLPAKMRE